MSTECIIIPTDVSERDSGLNLGMTDVAWVTSLEGVGFTSKVPFAGQQRSLVLNEGVKSGPSQWLQRALVLSSPLFT